jgi:hypothetical protein
MDKPHQYVRGGVSWAVLPDGISIDGAAPVGTAGPPETVRRVLGWFGPAIEAASDVFGVPKAVLVAIICNESAGGVTDLEQVQTARREEPGYVSEHATPDRVSVGCCQTLVSTARAALMRPALSALDLCVPETSILAAAGYIASQRRVTQFDPVLIAAAYNAGGLHPEPISVNRWGLRCYPLNTGQYIDRFVLWYNDAVAVLGHLNGSPS